MKTNTRYFGTVEYTKEDILYIPQGLFGFEDLKEYLLIHFDDEEDALLCLQSLQDETLAFVLTNPFSLKPDYDPQLSREDMDALGLSEDTPVSFYAICVIHEEISESTMNLRSPIAINPATRQARQVILEDTAYTFRHSFKELAATGKGEGNC